MICRKRVAGYVLLDMRAMTATFAIFRPLVHSRGFSSLGKSSIRRCCRESVTLSFCVLENACEDDIPCKAAPLRYISAAIAVRAHLV